MSLFGALPERRKLYRRLHLNFVVCWAVITITVVESVGRLSRLRLSRLLGGYHDYSLLRLLGGYHYYILLRLLGSYHYYSLLRLLAGYHYYSLLRLLQKHLSSVLAAEDADRQAGKQTSRQADKQTNRKADKQESRQADKQQSSQADKPESTQADKPESTQAGKHTSIQAGKQTSRTGSRKGSGGEETRGLNRGQRKPLCHYTQCGNGIQTHKNQGERHQSPVSRRDTTPETSPTRSSNGTLLNIYEALHLRMYVTLCSLRQILHLPYFLHIVIWASNETVASQRIILKGTCVLKAGFVK